MTQLEKTYPKVPFAYAANALARLCDIIDEGGDLDEAIITEFQGAKLDLADAVARRISFFEFCKGAINAAGQARDMWGDRSAQLTKVLKKVKAKTMEVMAAMPDQPYDSPLGKLRTQLSTPAIEVMASCDDANYTHVVSPYDIKKHSIDGRFLVNETITYLNMDEIKAALNAGEELTWARKTQGRHLRWK